LLIFCDFSDELDSGINETDASTCVGDDDAEDDNVDDGRISVTLLNTRL